jgi:hypothetical protein
MLDSDLCNCIVDLESHLCCDFILLNAVIEFRTRTRSWKRSEHFMSRALACVEKYDGSKLLC